MDADLARPKQRKGRLMTVALVFLLLGTAIYATLPQTVGEQSRRTVLKLLNQHYPTFDVSIGNGRYVNQVGLIFDDVVFRVRDQGPVSRRTFLSIDRLIVETTLELDRLQEHAVPVCAKRIIASGIEADLWPLDNGNWNIAELFPPPRMGPGCPIFDVRDARVRLHPVAPLKATSSPRPIELDRVNAVVTMLHPAALGSPAHRFVLKASSEYARHIAVEGTVQAGTVQLQGSAQAFRVDESLLQRLPMEFQASVKPLLGLEANGDMEFRLVQRPSTPPAFEVKANCHDGRFSHPSLPLPIEKISGLIKAIPSGVVIESGQVSLGDAICRVSGAIDGWTAEADMQLRLIASNLMITDRLAAALPQKAQVSLDRVRPRGVVDIDSRLTRQAGQWKADAVIDLQGVDISAERFPYPVTQVIGKVHFRDHQFWAEQLSGRMGGQRLNISFLNSEPGRGLPSWIRLAADGPVPIDSTLLNSLTPRGESISRLERFVRSLSPRGAVHLVSAAFNTNAAGQKTQAMDLQISSGSLRYIEFPYALYEVSGQIAVENQLVRLQGFRAKNSDNATIGCDGVFENLAKVVPRSKQGDWRVALRFQAANLPLDETIRAALPSASQQTWDLLAPTGVLDQLEVQVAHADTMTAPQLMISAQQHARPTVDSRTLSLRPTMLPYRLDVMQGAVRFDGQRVIIDALDARHDSTRVAADGACTRDSTGQWRLDLNVRSGSRLHPDTELVNALPNEVRGAFQRLQLRGPLSIRGSTSILLPNAELTEPTVEWGLTVQLEGNRIGDVGPVHDIRGELSVQGRRDGQSVIADGIVNIDSIHVNQQQITAIRGPFAIRDNRLFLGETIAVIDHARSRSTLNQAIRPIEGQLFGGVASLSGDVLLDNGNFDVAMGIREGDVATLLADIGETHSTAIGQVEGQVRLEGTMGASHLLKGTGSGKLSGSNLYQLPILIQVFNMLRVQPSEAVAFTDGEVRFSIYGDDITFNQLQLWGDLIALHGSGTMNRTKDVDLTFNTRVSPQNGWSELTRSFGENQYTLWTITVKGSLNDPLIERRALNTVNETLERLFPGIAEPTRPAGPISSRVTRLRDRVLK